MSRHYEFLHDDAQLLEEPEQLAEAFPEWEPADGAAALVIGNPWDAAGVITGTRSEIAARLRAYLALVDPGAGDDGHDDPGRGDDAAPGAGAARRLPTYRYADLSTGVLPRHEMDTTEKVPSLLTTVIVHEWGAWVRVPHPVLDAADLDPREWTDWPVLRQVLLLADRAGAGWLNLDRDGWVPDVPGLTAHPW
jgi:hypothetical protein